MIEGLQLYYKRLDLLQQYSLYLWVFCIFFPQLNFVTYVFVSVSLIKIINLQEYKKFKYTTSKLPYLLLLLFIAWNLVSLCYSENLYEGLKQVEKKLPMFLIIVVGLFGSTKNFVFEKTMKYYAYGALSVLSIGLCYVIYKIIQEGKEIPQVAQINFLGFFEHNLYIGMMLLMAIPLFFKFFLVKKNYKKQVLGFLCLGLLFFFMYHSLIRIIIFSIVVIGSFVKFVLLNESRDRGLIYCILVFSIILFGSTIYFHPKTKQLVVQLKNKEPLNTIDSRFISWNRATEILQEHPILGIGIGDYEDELLKQYKKNNNYKEYIDKRNAHNQFLQTGIETGSIGIVMLLLFLGSIFFANKDWRFYKVIFLIVFGSSFLIESVLSRNLGTFPMAFWLFGLLSMVKKSNVQLKKEKENSLVFFDSTLFGNIHNLN